jgi:hypothetical protein
VIELGLGIGREMLVEDRDQLPTFQQGPDHRQGAEVDPFGRRLCAVPSKRHSQSMGKLKRWRKTSCWKFVRLRKMGRVRRPHITAFSREEFVSALKEFLGVHRTAKK